ncbi:MAG: hypothetical protein JST54_17655 [Deltaproteobacteria bacterium]|nr:hypothetical protein [Deltaproteobacteria bacterium]
MFKLISMALVVLFAAGCGGSSSGSSSGSTGGSGNTGGTGGTGGSGSTGGSGGTQYNIAVTGPYAFSGTSPATAYTVSAGSTTQMDLNWTIPNGDHVGLTGTLTGVSAIAVHTYQPADFAHCGIGVDQAGGANLTNTTDPTCTVDVTSLGDNLAGEQNIHGTLTATWTATNAFPDGGSASGNQSITASF